MICRIVSPDNTTSYYNLSSITLPGYFGQMQILPQHTEVFVVLQRGEIILEQADGKKKVLKVSAGECHFEKETATIIF